MKKMIILKDHVPHFMDELMKEYVVFAPVNRDEITYFDRIDSSSELSLDLKNTRKPAKDVVFPKCETLFIFETTGSRVTVEEPSISNDPCVLVGIRPCDGRGLTILNQAFTLDEYKDVYYMQRLRNTTVIGLACDSPMSTCFCTSTGGNPFGKEGLDLLFEDLGDRYLVDIITEKGEEIVQRSPFFEDAGDVDVEMAEGVKRAAQDNMKSEITLEGVMDKLGKMFEDPLWDNVHQKCVGCGICSFFCPTCYCFDVVDEMYGSKGRRIRVWDTCQFPLFTKQASGVNPRPSEKERMRQRIMHKFNYFPEIRGELACVGCGRCVRECPVNVDVREVLKSIMER